MRAARAAAEEEALIAEAFAGWGGEEEGGWGGEWDSATAAALSGCVRHARLSGSPTAAATPPPQQQPTPPVRLHTAAADADGGLWPVSSLPLTTILPLSTYHLLLTTYYTYHLLLTTYYLLLTTYYYVAFTATRTPHYTHCSTLTTHHLL